MSVDQHTPGPWTAEAVMDDGPHDICAPSTPETGSPNVIATVLYEPEDESSMTLAEANANARLIAAAPAMREELKREREVKADLLAALRAIGSYVVTESPERPELKAAAQQRVDYLQAIARAAIAKAGSQS